MILLKRVHPKKRCQNHKKLFTWLDLLEDCANMYFLKITKNHEVLHRIISSLRVGMEDMKKLAGLLAVRWAKKREIQSWKILLRLSVVVNRE